MAKRVQVDLEKPPRPAFSTSSSSKSNHNDSPLPTAKKISFSIAVISVPLLYVSLLHTSPSSLFDDTKFWFLISNAIILIVAADSGVFASPLNEPAAADIYQEYVKHSGRAPKGSTGGLPRSGEPQRIQWRGKEPSASLSRLAPSRGSVPQKVEQTSEKERRPAGIVPELAAPPSADHVVESKGTVLFGMSASEKKGSGSSEEEEQKEEESEYAAMSDDELNRRVEEFIRRFNREIRRQEGATTEPS